MRHFNQPVSPIMKKRLLPVALALTLLFPCAALVRAQEGPPAGKHEEPETELGKTMEDLNRSWRKLRKQVSDPASNASSIELVAAIRKDSTKALTLEPDKARDIPEAERAKYIESYKKQMRKFDAKIGELSAAFKANDNAAAAALVKEIGAIQKEGHKEFKRPEK